MKILEEIEKAYRIHHKLIHGLSGLGLLMIVLLYFYSKSKESEQSKEVSVANE